MDLLLVMRDGTRYQAPAESIQAVLRYSASQAAVQPAKEVTVLTDSGAPARSIRWLNAAEIVEISEVADGGS